MPTPAGIFGTLSNPGANAQIVFIKDTNPYILGYKIYKGPSAGSCTLAGSFSTGSLPAGPLVVLNDIAGGTSFNCYYYIKEYGTLPDSPPSPVIHAVSGIRTINALSIVVGAGTTPLLSISSGSVPGSVFRLWMVTDSGGTPDEWLWSDVGATPANPSSVNYGFNTSGLTYISAYSLAIGIPYEGYVLSFNNENWNIDASVVAFTP
jgi:hypothetical protein